MNSIDAGDRFEINKWDAVEINGFYDGGGIYKVRFMPSFDGEYVYELGAMRKNIRIELPGKEFMAIRLRRSDQAGERDPCS